VRYDRRGRRGILLHYPRQIADPATPNYRSGHAKLPIRPRQIADPAEPNCRLPADSANIIAMSANSDIAALTALDGSFAEGICRESALVTREMTILA
jgi:hypothetical protein